MITKAEIADLRQQVETFGAMFVILRMSERMDEFLSTRIPNAYTSVINFFCNAEDGEIIDVLEDIKASLE